MLHRGLRGWRLVLATATALGWMVWAPLHPVRAAVPVPPPAVTHALNRAFPGQLRTAECIAWHESSYRLDAVSATDDYGLMAIHRPTWSWAFLIPGRIFELGWNVRVARVVYDETRVERGNGWLAWTTYRRYCA